jgi:hypothetical protein
LHSAESLDFWANVPTGNFGLFAIYVESRGAKGENEKLALSTKVLD